MTSPMTPTLSSLIFLKSPSIFSCKAIQAFLSAGLPAQKKKLQINYYATESTPVYPEHPSCCFRFSVCDRNIIQRKAQERNDQSRPGILRLERDEQDTKTQAHDDVEYRKYGISESFIGPLGIRISPAQDENAKDGQHVEYDHDERYHVEKIPVFPAKAPNAGKNALHPQ